MESGAQIGPVDEKKPGLFSRVAKRWKSVTAGGVSASVALWGYATFVPKDQFRELKRDTAAIEIRVNSQVTTQLNRVENSIEATNRRLDKTNERIDQILLRLPNPATASYSSTVKR